MTTTMNGPADGGKYIDNISKYTDTWDLIPYGIDHISGKYPETWWSGYVLHGHKSKYDWRVSCLYIYTVNIYYSET